MACELAKLAPSVTYVIYMIDVLEATLDRKKNCQLL